MKRCVPYVPLRHEISTMSVHELDDRVTSKEREEERVSQTLEDNEWCRERYAVE